MKFTFLQELQITKDFLLSKNSEETYMQTYLGIPVKKGLLISPLRKDRRPTASFYRNKKEELIFHDFGTGFHGNFIQVVMEIYHCSYYKALQIIAEDFNYIQKQSEREPIKIKPASIKIEEKQGVTIQIEKQDFQANELKWWESFGIHEKTLKYYNVFSCKNLFMNGDLCNSSSKYNPIYGYYFGKKNGDELWKIYFPKRTSYRFLSNLHGIIQGAKQLPSSGNLLVITKSLKDVMLLYEMGIPAIAPCSEVQFLTSQQIKRLQTKFKKIVVCFDNDATGIKFMRKLKKQYPDLSYYFIPRYLAKDPTDLYRKINDHQKFCTLIEQLKNYFLNEEK